MASARGTGKASHSHFPQTVNPILNSHTRTEAHGPPRARRPCLQYCAGAVLIETLQKGLIINLVLVHERLHRGEGPAREKAAELFFRAFTS